MNTNTAITQQLIQTVRTLEAEWWQVCREAWLRGQREMSQILGTFGLSDCTMLRPVLTCHAFRNLLNFYFFNFPNFFGAPVNRGYWIGWIRGPHVHSYAACVIFKCAHALAARSSPGSLPISLWPHSKVSFGLYAEWRCEADIDGSPAAGQSGYHTVWTYVTLWCFVIICVVKVPWSICALSMHWRNI